MSMRISDCGMRIAFRIGWWRSLIRNPQSAIRDPQYGVGFSMKRRNRLLWALVLTMTLGAAAAAQRGRGNTQQPESTPTPPGPQRVEDLKREVAADIESRRVDTQQMVDQVFSFGELGFQEVETSRYLIGILEKNGFTVEEHIAGIHGLDGDLGIGEAGHRPGLGR